MFAKLRERFASGERHYIDSGVVWCPVRQTDVDIERCLGCDALQRIGDEGEGSFVQCRPFAPPATQYEIR